MVITPLDDRTYWFWYGFRCLRCAATMSMTDLSIPWCCPSTIYAVFLYDDCHLLFPRIIFGSVLWRQTWPIHDNLRRLPIKVPDVRRGYWPAAMHIRSFLLSVWYAKHLLWHLFSKSWIRLATCPQSASICHNNRAVVGTRRVTAHWKAGGNSCWYRYGNQLRQKPNPRQQHQTKTIYQHMDE